MCSFLCVHGPTGPRRSGGQVERLKATVKQERDAREEAVRQLRRAERQKMDLLSAFKKQLRLINILKRQKIHVRWWGILCFCACGWVCVCGGGGGQSCAVSSTHYFIAVWICRQIEAAKLLSFTEDEFTRIIDMEL